MLDIAFAKLPHHDSGTYTDIQRMLRAELRYFNHVCRLIDDILIHPIDFISEYQNKGFIRQRTNVLKQSRFLRLLNGTNCMT